MYASPLSADFIYQGRGELYAQLEGSPGLIHMGIVNEFSVQAEADETDVMSSNLEVRAKVATLSNEVKVTAKFKSISLTRSALALALMGLSLDNAIAANANYVVNIANVKTGEIYDLGRSVSDVGLVIGDTALAGSVKYEAGVNYELIGKGRLIRILSIPATAGADMVVKGTAPAVAGGVKIGIGGNASQRAKLLFVGLEAGKEAETAEIWSGIIRPDGEVPFIGENDPIELSFTLSADAVPGKPAGFAFGQVTRG